ncbi:sugar transferase [Flavobacterium sp. WV_118_3]|uniref:sugar transferase n=1 Tax=Flavobacterium sp. WV_118_3 TaxID=3151764 RepID=UPI0032193592
MYRTVLKPLFDFILAFSGLLLLSPIFIIAMIALFIANDGKPFFFQVRPGKNERLFKIIKFKTMNDKRDENGNLLPDSERLTKVGSFVRKTSLDEIPQLLNVIKGDMSLIGPRPLLPKYLPFYTEKERRRHTVRPGITGLAQVNGRNTVAWDERLAFDVAYVENITFLNDVSIIMQSVKAVLLSKGVTVDPTSIMKNLDDERKGSGM